MVLDQKGDWMKIAVALPFHTRDMRLAADLLLWIQELGKEDFHCYLVCPFISFGTNKQMLALTMGAFKSVEFVVPSSIGRMPEPWPSGANKMFAEASKLIKQPFLWLEPDAVPLCDGWLEYINEEYFSVGKPFMGSVNKDAKHPKGHLSGVAVYPPNSWNYFRGFLPSKEPFDMVNQDEILANTYDSKLIYNFWGQNDMPPTFKENLEKSDPENTLTLGSIPRTAVLYHRCKDQSLTNILRNNRRKALE